MISTANPLTRVADLLLYATTLFVGAGLLFVVQPMVGKMILPFLGGTPAVWNTCMVFFQAALLAGYAYAHATTRWLGVRRQAALHLVVLALPLAALPLGVESRPVRGGETNPVLDVLLLLSLSVGLPFLVVSATAPLLQKWFTETGHPAARDPYFLYAASNLGSMLALLGYPLLLEPRLSLRGEGWMTQTRLWTAGYVVLAVLIALCAVVLWRSPRRARVAEPGTDAVPPDAIEDAPTLGDRWRWIALAAVPSSLLLGVTTYITTDIAAVPLLWVLPLALYLLTFILAFGRWPGPLQRAITAITVPAVLTVIFFMVSGYHLKAWASVLWHLGLLLVAALACHGKLARARPAPSHLTEFYLLIALGGVLGGLFNALIAPLVFTSLFEYPLAMVLAGVLVHLPDRRPLPRPGDAGGRSRFHDWLLVVAVPVCVTALALLTYSDALTIRLDVAPIARILGVGQTPLATWLGRHEHEINKVLIYGLPLAVCFLYRRRPAVLGLALAGVLLVAEHVDDRRHDQLRQARSFFGVLRVTRDREETGYIELRHGTTIHGRQSRDPARRGEPLSYYHRQGPVGRMFAELDRRDTSRRVAVVGLGTGTIAAYARPGEAMTIYEIDRLVRDIAFDRAYFTYVRDAQDRGASLRVELGDARIRLDVVRRERPGERYDLLIVDAFTSDAIPVHLITREALRLYVDMLTPRGLLALHVSNRYLRLEPVVAALAADAELGGQIVLEDSAVETQGGLGSTWIVLARTPQALGDLGGDERVMAKPLQVEPKIGVWTDDFHNLLSVFKW
jgi:spermidine synthase